MVVSKLNLHPIMTEGFFPLTLKKIVRETEDAKSFYFEIPQNLKDKFTYTAGQYLTFEAEIDSQKIRRSYSLCTYDGVDDDMAVSVKKVEGGKMSEYMNGQLQVGDVLSVMPPLGNFTVIPQVDRVLHYVLFAGGSGITPIMGIAKAVLADEPKSKVSLVYANRNSESVIYKQDLVEMEKKNSGRFQVFHNYDKAPMTYFGMKGQLTIQKIESIVKSKISGSFDQFHYYICGPGPMMEIVKKGLHSLGIAPEKVYTEYFSAPIAKSPADEKPQQETDFDGVAKITISVYGKTHTISCDQNTTVLNAAMKEGIDPPYSCTVGVCTTCRAKVSKGKIHMIEREGLSDAEIAEGYVLTCQSVPRSAEITLQYG
ncbi:MAG: oxidoreductase [Flavobacteriales bacterium]|nr:MAG: oxidoreductase [Flavobacteriales bacterium]